MTPTDTTPAPAPSFCDHYRVSWAPRDSEAPRREADERLREALRVAFSGKAEAS